MKVQRAARRYDLGQLGKAEKTPQGFLKCAGFATRCGVFTYIDADGSVRRELRHPDDVNTPESLVTLKYAPVTVEHPPDLITPENVDQYRRGHTTERVEVNRDLVETDFIIESQEAIDAVEKDGMRETSSGYTADIIEEEGIYNGAPYNFRQKEIRYNHVAIVKRGRAGPEVRLRLDSADAVMRTDEEVLKAKPTEFGTETSVSDAEESGTKKVVISGREVELPAAEADIVQDMLDRYDELRAKTMKVEEDMKASRKDEDVSKPAPSPQVKVEQMMPDGRSAAGKIGPADKMGPGRAKGIADDDDEEEHGVVGGVKPNERKAGAAALKDEDEHEDDDKEHDDAGEVPGDVKESQGFKEKGIGDKKDYEGAGGVGAGMAPADLLKKELEEVENAIKMHSAKKADLQAKMDEYANQSMAGGEKKMDSASFKAAVRARAKLERKAATVLPEELTKRFDSWSDAQIMAAVIKHRKPKADLEGVNKDYLRARFDSIVEAEEELAGTEVRTQMGRAMLGQGVRNDSSDQEVNPGEARLRMIQGSRDLWKAPLSAGKK